jgi:hypothetical protein
MRRSLFAAIPAHFTPLPMHCFEDVLPWKTLFCFAPISVIFGRVCLFIADSRGKSSLSGFLCELFLAPLGIFIALLFGRNDEAIPDHSFQDGQARRCVGCAEVIQQDAMLCRFCG